MAKVNGAAADQKSAGLFIRGAVAIPGGPVAQGARETGRCLWPITGRLDDCLKAYPPLCCHMQFAHDAIIPQSLKTPGGGSRRVIPAVVFFI